MVQLLLISLQYYDLLITISSKVADEISAKLLPSFLECELLVVIPDRYGFKFTVKGKKTPDRRLNSYTGN